MMSLCTAITHHAKPGIPIARIVAYLVGLMLAVGSSGCSAPPPTTQRTFAFAPNQYPQAFNTSRQVLMDMGFSLDRIDAASGVLTTQPHFSQGILEPWDVTQSSIGDEWEDAVNHQARSVRILFAANDATTDSPSPSTEQTAGPKHIGRVQVTLYREQRAGRQLNSIAVGASSYTFDPLMAQRHGMRYLVPVRRDRALEARIATTIASQLASPKPSN